MRKDFCPKDREGTYFLEKFTAATRASQNNSPHLQLAPWDPEFRAFCLFPPNSVFLAPAAGPQ